MYINICGSTSYQCVTQDEKQIIVRNEKSTQNIIIAENDECDFYSKQHDYAKNDLMLINENNPFAGVVLKLQGVEDDENMELLLICSNSDTFEIQTPCEQDYCIKHNSVCPILVTNPIMKFYQYLYIPLGVIFILLGIALMIFGFQFLRFTTVLLAFMIGTAIYTIVLGEAVLDQDSSNFAIIIIFCSGIGVGIIYANTTYVRYLLGVFNMGLIFGVVLSLLMQPLFLHLFNSHPMFLTLTLTFSISGLLFGFLACKFLNTFGIGATALAGSYLFIKPIGWFASGYPNEIYLVKRAFYGFEKEINFRFYLYFSSIMVLTIGSVFYQYRQLRKRMSMDEMFAYKEMDYCEMGNFEKANKSEVKGFADETEVVMQSVQFVKKLSEKGKRKSDSSDQSQ
ncbi:unnamed protein product [Paramecium pentaurelia]|uniref:Transmembrane protein 198 n=1 Tax=Paramecium pentaurelia TaxID=43138 RepID=A0A8S1XFA9_9CILI|nr:unnamed protein product [Paramecium pentaurelia]